MTPAAAAKAASPLAPPERPRAGLPGRYFTLARLQRRVEWRGGRVDLADSTHFIERHWWALLPTHYGPERAGDAILVRGLADGLKGCWITASVTRQRRRAADSARMLQAHLIDAVATSVEIRDRIIEQNFCVTEGLAEAVEPPPCVQYSGCGELVLHFFSSR